jgi:hypothetical protein
MGTFTYRVGDRGSGLLSIAMPFETKAVVAAELRDKGLNSIAASLEGTVNSKVCGVIQAAGIGNWRQTLDTDIVELVKRRYFVR